MVEFRDGKPNSRTGQQSDGALGGQIFGDAKRDRQDQRERSDQRGKENPRQPQVQPQRDNRPQDFTPPRTRENPRIQPVDTTTRPPQQRDLPPRVNPRDQFPNFPNVNPDQQRPGERRRPDQPNGPRPGDNVTPRPRVDTPSFPNVNPDLRQRPDQTRPNGPRPGENITPKPRIEFPDLRPQTPRVPTDQQPRVNPTDRQPRVNPTDRQPRVNPPTDLRPAVPSDRNRPAVPFFPGTPTETKPTDLFHPQIKPGVVTPTDVRPNTPNNPKPNPYDFNPNDRQQVRPKTQPRVDVPTVLPPADTPPAVRVNPGTEPRVDNPNPKWKTDNNPNPAWPNPSDNTQPRVDNPNPKWKTDNNPNPAWPQQTDRSQYRPQKPNVLNNIVQDLLIGPQPRPGQYYPGGHNPGFYPQRPTTPAGILSDVVSDLINPGQNYPRPGCDPNYPNYDPRMDVNNPSYDPRLDPRCNPRSPLYNPQMDRNNPNYDVRRDPRFAPRPGYDPGYGPGYDPGYGPGYEPGYNPRYPQNPNNAARRIIGDVIGDLLSPRSGPGCNPDVYNPNYPPTAYPLDYTQPQRFPNGRFPQNGQVRDFIRQGLGNLRNNPQAFDGLLSGLGGLLGGGDTQFNIDRERGELNLAMDFTRAYDSITQKQGMPPNPEIRRVLGGLDSINLSADAMNLNWKGEQLVKLGGDQAQGPLKDMRILLGGGTNRTSFQIQSNETRLNLSNIQGLEAVDPQGNRLRVHMVDLDTSDPAGPKGSITIDNPVAKPQGLPPTVQWPEQVAIPIPMNGPEQKQMADALPGLIRTINSTRNAVKSGDLSQLTGNLNPGDLANIIGMLKGPRPQPVNPDQYIQPEVPPTPQPEFVPNVPAPPEPGIREVPAEPVQVVPTPPEPGIPADATRGIRSLGNVDYLDLGTSVPAPQDKPEAPSEIPVPPPPGIVPPAAETTVQPANPITFEPRSNRLGGGSILRSASLLSSTYRDTLSPTVKPAVPAEQPPAELPVVPKAPDAVAPTAEVPVAPAEVPVAPKAEVPAPPKTEVPPQPSATDNTPRGGRAEELLRANGIKVEAKKIGTERLFNMIFADADQNGPMVTGFNKALADRRFLQDVSTIGSTLNRFDVDKSRKSITFGLDFANAYDTIQTDQSKYKPETKQFLSGLEAVTITPDQISLKLNRPGKLPMDGEGIKKADLWLGTDNGETTFNYQTTENSVTMTVKGLQVEVAALKKTLNVYEVKVDTSTGVASATALIDNPFEKPPGVPESTWSKTIQWPLELGKTPEEVAEANKRLPQTLKSLHAIHQGAQSGAMAQRIGNLTKEDIIALLKFQ